MMKFYGTMVCPDCVKAREALNAAGVLFDYVDITVSTANMNFCICAIRTGSLTL